MTFSFLAEGGVISRLQIAVNEVRPKRGSWPAPGIVGHDMRFVLVGLSGLYLTFGFLAEDGVLVNNADEAEWRADDVLVTGET